MDDAWGRDVRAGSRELGEDPIEGGLFSQAGCLTGPLPLPGPAAELAVGVFAMSEFSDARIPIYRSFLE